MKLLIFAHAPPPYHGQSYMVQLMLAGLGGDRRMRVSNVSPPPGVPSHGLRQDITCYHVNVRLSHELADIGEFRVGKFFLLLGYCVQALWCRLRYGVTNFYYIPAPGKPSALYRDWLVMLLCRPFFKRFIFHWHASGLGKWLETARQIRSRSLTYWLMKKVDLSIVLSSYGRADAEKFYPARVAVVGNGIPDPCPHFSESVLPRRKARASARKLLLAKKPLPPDVSSAAGDQPHVVKVLFLAHCTEDKGLFDAARGAVLAHQQLVASKSPLSMKLLVAGQFVYSKEQAEFHRLCAAGRDAVEYVGFAAGEKKRELFEHADIFCFPSHLESFGLVLAEAMAFGLPIVASRCGAMPEVLSGDYPGLVPPRAPAQIAAALLRMSSEESFAALRQRFETKFTIERFLDNLAAAFHSVEQPATTVSEGSAPALVAVGY
jgi:glycosyltransferase involved in cell wall biosynthesis